MVRPYVQVTPSSLFFNEDCPYYVNRVYESYELQLHRHEFTEICYIAEGAGTQYIGDQTIPVGVGDLFVLPVGTSHVFRPSSPASPIPLVVYNFVFDSERVAAALEPFPGFAALTHVQALIHPPAGEPGWRAFKDSSQVFERLMHSAYEEIRLQPVAYLTKLHSLFLQLMTELERQLRATPASGGGVVEGDPLLARAFAYIHNHYTMPLTAAQAAAEAELSERHFHRLFRQAAGVTFTRYLQDLRLARSRELLRNTRLTIPQIAEAVGYQDKGFFLALFKKRMGQTPRDYRRLGTGV